MRIPLSVSLTCLAAAIPAQDVEFETYTLDNGLQVILHEDHSLPVATVNLWYHVGSKDEAGGRSGFAHLFEHLMFMGTERVPGSGFDELMEAGGGSNNASTSRDRTNYFSSGPSSLLPTLLWLDADRMAAFGKAMTQEKLDKQREVVRNERRETVEMRPYGKSRERLGTFLYPPSHPYHTSVIGSHADLEAATLDDVKGFFATYYVPNNASLVVAGDFDPKEFKPLIEKWYGAIPRGAVVPRKDVPPVALDRERRVVLEDRVQFARVTVVWLSPKFFAPGDAEMDLAASVLADGKTSRLYKRLVYEDKLCTSIQAYQWSSLHGSQFHVEATARPEAALDAIEKAIDEEVARFVDNGPTADELHRARTSLEYGAVTRLQSLSERADALNSYNFYLGKPNGFRFDLDRYRKAGTGDVRSWSARVLRPDARLVMRVLPEQKTAKNPLDERPGPPAERAFEPQLPQRFTLSNGIEVQHWHRPQLPLASAVLLAPGGSASEPAAKAGLTSLLCSMLDEGAGTRSALQFSDDMTSLGASFGASTGRHYCQVSLQSLRGRFEAALALFADAILRPRFDAGEWERVKTLHLRGLQARQDSAGQLARVLATRAFFGAEHPYGHPVDGMPATVERVSIEDVRARWKAVFRPDGARLLVAGALTAGEARAMLETALGSWERRGTIAATGVPPAPRAGKRVFVVDKPGTPQAVIRFMMPGPRAGHPDRMTFQAINTVLGGAFTSRLNANLREKHGFTYGAGSGYSMWPATGVLVASASVQAEVTRRALEEFLRELESIRTGNVTPAEARKARSTNYQQLVASMEGLGGLLQIAAALETGGLSFANLKGQLDALSRVDAAAMNAKVEEAVQLQDACLLMVGDAKRIVEQVRGLGLPQPVLLDTRGEPVPGR